MLSESSDSIIVSSISVISVPFEDGAIGEGSLISVRLAALGDRCGGGIRWPEPSERLSERLGAVSIDKT